METAGWEDRPRRVYDHIPVKDIRGYVHQFLVTKKFKSFCDEHNYYTESGNYSTTAETVYRFIFNDTDFIEAHTALNDSEIEAEILKMCISAGASLEEEYKTFRSIEKVEEKTLHIKTAEQTDYYFDYTKIRINKNKTEIILR